AMRTLPEWSRVAVCERRAMSSEPVTVHVASPTTPGAPVDSSTFSPAGVDAAAGLATVMKSEHRETTKIGNRRQAWKRCLIASHQPPLVRSRGLGVSLAVVPLGIAAAFRREP